MPKCQSTEVPTGRTIGAIRKILIPRGVTSLGTIDDVDPVSHQVTAVGLGFAMMVRGREVPFRFTVPIKLGRNATQNQRAQAERTAYRNIYWWLENAVNLADIGCVELERALLAWIAIPDSAGGGNAGDHILTMLEHGGWPAVPVLMAGTNEIEKGE